MNKIKNVLLVSGLLVAGVGCETTVSFAPPVMVAPVEVVQVDPYIVVTPVYPIFEYDVIWVNGERRYRHREEYRHSHEEHRQENRQQHQDTHKKNKYNQ